MSGIDPIWLVAISFVLALFPLGVGLVTSYIKISVVLGMLRNGLGTQQVPGNVVIMALSLAMTSFIMSPIFSDSVERLRGINITELAANPGIESFEKLAPVLIPWRQFLQKHSGVRELRALVQFEGPVSPEVPLEEATHQAESPQGVSESRFRILIPAFILTELKESFAMGFVLLLPFLAIDLIVANILVGLGMSMMSPVMISLPLKLILFVVSDGWILLSKGLISSYGV